MDTDAAIEKLQKCCDENNLPFDLNWDYDNNGQLVIYTDAYLVNGQWISSDLLGTEFGVEAEQ
jgi:antitoxin component of RelBE/YafQ-DinJ toxin-antitoxin module